MTKKISESILLTGAGFTYNFGGFLAERMWAEIFNHPEIQQSQSIREQMLEVFNYELVHDIILYEKRFSDRDKESIKTAVFEAYRKLDYSIYDFLYSAHYRLTPELKIDLESLFKRFAGDKNTISFYFTLNQDVFMERLYGSSPFMYKPLRLPGHDIDVIPKNNRQIELEPADFITLKENVDNVSINALSSEEFNFIKLHGSYNWRSSDGSNAMAIGLEKESYISREPLLKRYFEIFKKVLAMPNRKLLVIGYSFRDKHVNEIIAESIDKYGLKLFVLSPENPQQFVNKFFRWDEYEEYRLPSDKYTWGKTILKGLTGYYPLELNRESLKTIDETYFGKTE